MPRVSGGSARLVVAGVYGALLDSEQGKVDRGDPRVRADPLNPRKGFMRRPTRLLEDLEAGLPVRVPVWRIGGRTAPDDRLRRLKRGDRSITGWLVSPDDSVIALREDERR